MLPEVVLLRRVHDANIGRPAPPRAERVRPRPQGRPRPAPGGTPVMRSLRPFLPFLRGSQRRLLLSLVAALVQAGLLVVIGLLVRRAFDQNIPDNDVGALALTGAAILGVALAAAGLTVWMRYLVLGAVKDAISRLRVALLERLNALPDSLVRSRRRRQPPRNDRAGQRAARCRRQQRRRTGCAGPGDRLRAQPRPARHQSASVRDPRALRCRCSLFSRGDSTVSSGGARVPGNSPSTASRAASSLPFSRAR